MKQYRLEATPAVELDIEVAFEWYEREKAGLGFQFLDELRAAIIPSATRIYVQEFVSR